MKTYFKLAKAFSLSAIMALSCSSISHAQVTPDFQGKIEAMAAKNNLTVYSISESAIPNYLEIDLSNGKTILVSENLDYGVAYNPDHGISVLDFVSGADFTSQRKYEALIGYVETAPLVAVYEAKSEKAAITVFTDPQCHYCQKLHKEVPKLNNSGVTVRYIATPNYEGSKLMLSAVACSKKPQATMDSYIESLSKAAEEGRIAASRENTVDMRQSVYQHAVAKGKQAILSNAEQELSENPMCGFDIEEVKRNTSGLGISGTPLIVYPNGKLQKGADSSDAILANLGLGE